MKKLALISFAAVLASGSVFAATDYVPGNAVDAGPNGASYIYKITNTPNFVVNNFGFSLSAQVSMDSLETKSKFAVATGSARGKHSFTGSSEGGSVGTCTDITSSLTSADLGALIELANRNGCSANSAIGS